MNKMHTEKQIRSIYSQTHITSLCTYQDKYLIFAQGSSIEIRYMTHGHSSQFYRQQIFDGCNVYRIKLFIRPNDQNPLLVVFGNRFFSLFELIANESTLSLKALINNINVDDWILEVRIQGQYLYCVLALNQLLVYDWTNQKVVSRVACVEKCILYSACLMQTHSPSKVRLAAGTAFTEILICDYSNGTECQVKQRLKGHEGVLFTIDYASHLNLLVSASDDRTVRIWKQNQKEFQLLHTLYGHESRIWQVLLVDDCIVSAGENSSLYFWSYDGQLLNKERRKDVSIWAICTDMGGKNLFFARSDGTIGNKCITDCIEPSQKGCLEDLQSVKCFVFKPIQANQLDALGKSIRLVVTDEFGDWHQFDVSNQYLKLSGGKLGNDFKKYNVLAVHPNGCRVAVGTACGRIVEFDPNSPDTSFVDYGQVNKGKIFKLLYINDLLMSNGPEGELKIWLSPNECKTFNFRLAKNSWISCAVRLSNGILVFGDRCGNVFAYDLQGNQKALFVSIHSKIGVSALLLHPKDPTLFYSAGRDGRVIEYQSPFIDQVYLLRVFCTGMTMNWIGQLFFDPVSGNLKYIVGFLAKVFLVWCEVSQTVIWSVECGGGNRMWDFCFENNQLHFVYVKGSQLHFYRKQINRKDLPFVSSQFHLDTVLGSCSLFRQDHQHNKQVNSIYYVTGGEDNSAIISRFDCFLQQPIECATLLGHISNIRTLATLPLPDDSASGTQRSLLVTAGGRSQMMIWNIECDKNEWRPRVQQLASHFLWNTDKQCRKPWKENVETVLDPQIRYTAIDLHQHPHRNNCHVITATCTDCTLKQFLFCSSTGQIKFIQSIQLGEHCLLSLVRQSECLMTGSTDGKVRFLISNELKEHQIDSLLSIALPRWTKNPLEVLIEPEAIEPNSCTLDDSRPLSVVGELSLHQSGVNCLDSIVSYELKDPHILLATGGDDTHVCLSLCKIQESKSQLLSMCKNKKAHWASVAAVKLLRNDRLITCSSDNRVRLFGYTIESVGLDAPEIKLVALRSIISSIADICSMNVSFCKKSNQAYVIVFGEGQQLFQVCL